MSRTEPDRGEVVLASLVAYKRSLEADIKELRGTLKAVNTSIRLLGAGKAPTAEQLSLLQEDSFVGVPPQQAVEGFLRKHPRAWFKAGAVAGELKRLGFPTVARNFSSQVGVTLKRLWQKGVAERRKGAGAYEYGLKRQGGTSSDSVGPDPTSSA